MPLSVLMYISSTHAQGRTPGLDPSADLRARANSAQAFVIAYRISSESVDLTCSPHQSRAVLKWRPISNTISIAFFRENLNDARLSLNIVVQFLRGYDELGNKYVYQYLVRKSKLPDKVAVDNGIFLVLSKNIQNILVSGVPLQPIAL